MYYTLPHTRYLNTLQYSPILNTNTIFINQSTHEYLFQIKQQIQLFSFEWGKYEESIYPYKLISDGFRGVSKSIGTIIDIQKPVSSSYYKCAELFSMFQLLPEQQSVNTFHICDEPCGFMQFISHKLNPLLINNQTCYRQTNNTDKIGFVNLYSTRQYESCIQQHKGKMHLVTANCGLSYSTDFQHCETATAKMVCIEVIYALAVQAIGGNFVLKIYDIFCESTVTILYLLSSLYESVSIIKPQISNPAQSEKYIICTGYLHKMENNLQLQHHLQESLRSILYMILASPTSIFSIYPLKNIPMFFINKIEEYSNIYVHSQINAIQEAIVFSYTQHKTIHNLIEFDKMNKWSKVNKNAQNTNIQKCIQWCLNHNIHFM